MNATGTPSSTPATTNGVTYCFALTVRNFTDTTLPLQRIHLMEHTTPFDGYRRMTEMFKFAFRAAFTTASRYQVDDKTVQIDALTAQLRDLTIYHSPSHALDGTEQQTYVLVCVIGVCGATDPDAVQRQINAAYDRPQGKRQLLEQFGFAWLLPHLGGATERLIGHNTWCTDEVAADYIPDLSAVFAFYVFGWILLIRIERVQMAMSLRAAANSLTSATIIKQRLRLINFARFFLTDHRSNNLLVKEFCRSLTAKLRYAERYAKTSATHRDFEHHLDNISKAQQSDRLGTVSNMIFWLTVLSIPIAFFSALFAINYSSPIMQDAISTLADLRVYFILFGGFVLVVTPICGLILFDRLRNRTKKGDHSKRVNQINDL